MVSVAQQCDVRGSLSAQPDLFSGVCRCKENTRGDDCSQCQPGTFHLALTNPGGCITCFCSGVTSQCASSSLYRSKIFTSLTSGDIRGFSLTDSRQFESHTDNLYVDPRLQKLVFTQFERLQPAVYYWKLPAKYLGNKLTAYGGYLEYTSSYRPGLDSVTNGDPEVLMSVRTFEII